MNEFVRQKKHVAMKGQFVKDSRASLTKPFIRWMNLSYISSAPLLAGVCDPAQGLSGVYYPFDSDQAACLEADRICNENHVHAYCVCVDKAAVALK